MKLTPSIIRQLQAAAEEYGDDRFFGIWSTDHEFFVCNWVFGLRFLPGEIMNCPHVRSLEDETDRICEVSETKKDIIRHMYERSWMDILIGTGIYQDVSLVRIKEDELRVFHKRGWRVIPFETDSGRRFYIREGYFDVAEEAIGEEISPTIFRPVSSQDYPQEYRPMLLQDGKGEMRGLISAFSEENMRNPIDKTKEYKRIVEQTMPELCEDEYA